MTHVVGKRSGTTYRLDPAALIGQGVEGKAYRSGKKCIKVFSRPLPREDVEKIAALILLSKRVPGFAWPTEIVTNPDTGEAVGFAMDFVSGGESLEGLLDARATAAIAVPIKVRIALEAARAVAAAHAVQGPVIILKDVIKAGNLVICDTQTVFVDAATVTLLGFRVATGDVRDAISTLTTPGYVPREVLENPLALPSHAGDLFALAVLLFELFCGRAPHEPKPCPAAVGLEPDEAVRKGIYPRFTKHPEFEAPTYDPIDLPRQVDDLFRAAFLSSGVRPSADQWCAALETWLRRITPKLADPGLLPLPTSSPWAWVTIDRVALILFSLVLLARSASWVGQAWASPSEPLAHSVPGPLVPPLQRPIELPSPPPTPVGPPLFKELFP